MPDAAPPSSAVPADAASNSIQVRAAVAADEAILALFNRRMALETENRELAEATVLAGVRAALADPSKAVYYVAAIGARPAGQLMLTYEWSDWRNAVFWWIQSVYVDPDQRGRGVFRALYRHVEQLAARTPDVCGLRLYVESANLRAMRVYEKLGLKKSHYEMFEIDFHHPRN